MVLLQTPTSSNMKKKAVIKKEKFACDFCGKEFARETSLGKHLCETKRRINDQENRGNQIGFQAWLDFYKKNTATKKKRTYLDFAKSAYYIAFVKFGNYCLNVQVMNVSRYIDFLLKEQISIDHWAKDSSYTKFIIWYSREEDPLDAIARSIEYTISLSQEEGIQTKDCLRYGNRNKICYAVTTGKISPWMLYHSQSGLEFIQSLDHTQQKMILEYIDPEKWAIKFHKSKNILSEVKELLSAGGY